MDERLLLLDPAVLLAAELAEQLLRLLERLLRLLEPRAQRLGLARALGELGLEARDAVVDLADLGLALREPRRARRERGLGLLELAYGMAVCVASGSGVFTTRT